MRVLVVLALLGACVESSPGRSVEARLTYAGVRSTTYVDFPAYTFTDDPGAVDPAIYVVGVLRDRETPISRASLRVDEDSLAFVLHVRRNPGDDYRDEPDIVCDVPEEELGHAVPCQYSIHPCSIVLEEVGPP